MLKQNAIRAGAVIAACTATSLFSTGCRSFPGAGMFARRGPSAEALAGGGPSTKFPAPVPPSHTAEPEAIASIAGGTAVPNAPSAAESATAQVAGIEISPGFALPAGSDPDNVNMAAAQANGSFSPGNFGDAPPPSFVSNPVPTSAGAEGFGAEGFGAPGGQLGLPNDLGDVPSFGNATAMTAPSGAAPSGMGSPAGTDASGIGGPSGYAFGSKALTPKTTPEPSFASTSPSEASTPSFAMPTSSIAPPSTEIDALPEVGYGQAPAGGGFTLPGNVAQLPGSAPEMPSSVPSMPNEMPSMPIGGPSMPMGVASMPSDAPAMAELTPPATPSVELSPTSVDPVLPPEVTAPSYSPSFSTARAPGSSSFGSSSMGGYGPGSTGTSGGYPTSDSAPTTSGSFYR